MDTHTQSFSDPLSGSTRGSQYQKKHSPTHAHEEEEGFTQTRSIVLELIPFTGGLLDSVKPGGQLRSTASAFNQPWTNMPAIFDVEYRNNCRFVVFKWHDWQVSCSICTQTYMVFVAFWKDVSNSWEFPGKCLR